MFGKRSSRPTPAQARTAVVQSSRTTFETFAAQVELADLPFAYTTRRPLLELLGAQCVIHKATEAEGASVIRTTSQGSVLGLQLTLVGHPTVSMNHKGSLRVDVQTTDTATRGLWTPDEQARFIDERDSGVIMSHMIGRPHETANGFYVIGAFDYFSPEARGIVRELFATAVEQLGTQPPQ